VQWLPRGVGARDADASSTAARAAVAAAARALAPWCGRRVAAYVAAEGLYR